MKRRYRVYGYLGARWPGATSNWRYRGVSPCGWSFDAPADYYDKIRVSIEEHRTTCPRCP